MTISYSFLLFIEQRITNSFFSFAIRHGYIVVYFDFFMNYGLIEKRLNPIVNEDYQICSPLKKSHNTFPKRIKFDKPKPK